MVMISGWKRYFPPPIALQMRGSSAGKHRHVPINRKLLNFLRLCRFQSGKKLQINTRIAGAEKFFGYQG
jgi:hypothetical protein